MWVLICKDCRRAADVELLGLIAHAQAGCKSAQVVLAQDVTIGTPYDVELLRLQEEDAASFCDCQHKDVRLVNLDRVDPAMREEILGRG